MKSEVNSEEEEVENIYQLDEDQSGLDETNIDVITDAVKATLANQTGYIFIHFL